MPKVKPLSKAKVKQRIYDHEMIMNGMARLNGATVEVKNIRRGSGKQWGTGGWQADCKLIFEDHSEEYPNVFYPDKMFNAKKK